MNWLQNTKGKSMENISVLISKEAIETRIQEMADKINHDFAGQEVHLVGILKGSVFFVCELAKRLTIPVTMDFMSVSSYGAGTESSGRVKIVMDLSESIEGRNVIVVEDIIDSGNTLSYLLPVLSSRKPKSIRLITLLDKPDRRVSQVEIDESGFVIPDAFVVGFGLDYAQKYRNLPYIGVVEA